MTDKGSKRVLAQPRGSASATFRIHPDHLDDPKMRLDGVRLRQMVEETGPEVEVAVCNGRTVCAPSPSGEKRIAGYDINAQQYTYCLVEERFGPGQKLMLRESEANRLKELGFVCSPESYKPLPPPLRDEDPEVKHFGPAPTAVGPSA